MIVSDRHSDGGVYRIQVISVLVGKTTTVSKSVRRRGAGGVRTSATIKKNKNILPTDKTDKIHHTRIIAIVYITILYKRQSYYII